MGTDIHIVAEYFKDNRWHLADILLPEDRNYCAFAVLADVRNGYGFAGFDSGDPVIPISEPRGLPNDISQELRANLDGEKDEWLYLGNHSFSWVTLKELLDYDLDAPATVRGMVPSEAAKRFKEFGEIPTSWSNWTSKPNFERIEWQEPIRQRAWLIPMLIDEIKVLGEPDKVRLVFGFDD